MRQQYDYSDLAPKQSAQQYDFSDLAPKQPSTLDGALSTLGHNLSQGARELNSGVIRGVQYLANTPHDLVDVLQQGLGTYYPKGLDGNSAPVGTDLASHIPTWNTPMSSIENTMGVQNPGLPGKTLELAGTIAPLLIGGGTKAASALGEAASGIGKLADFFRPQKQAQGIIDSLGQGKSLEENAQSLASDVKNAFGKNYTEGMTQYSPVFNDTRVVNTPMNPTSYSNLDSDIVDGYDRSLKSLHNKFIDDPSFENAHALQSQLGSAIRKLQSTDVKGNLSISDRSIMQGYQEAQSTLKGEMDGFLHSLDMSGGLADQYKNATSNWLKNVVPYFDNPAIAKIAKGDVTNPDINSIKSIFGSPEPEIQKIVQDIGPEANRKILFSEIGKMGGKPDAAKLANVLNDSGLLDKIGLSTYSTPEFKNSIDALSKSIGYSKALKYGAGIAGATAIGKQLPLISYLIPGGH